MSKFRALTPEEIASRYQEIDKPKKFLENAIPIEEMSSTELILNSMSWHLKIIAEELIKIRQGLEISREMSRE